VTRTFPASGRFSPAQRRVYQVVLEAQEQAIARVRPGVTLEDLHQVCVERLTAGMVELGLLDGPAAARIEDDILVTADGAENLSVGIPRTADDVEAWLR
jgi:Xaa-Pro aminopeptidase